MTFYFFKNKKTFFIIGIALGLFVVFFQSRARADASPKERLAVIFKKGKDLYDAGKKNEAMEVWNSASGSWDADPSIKRAIEFFENKIQGKAVPPALNSPPQVLETVSTPVEETFIESATPQSLPPMATEPDNEITPEEIAPAAEEEMTAKNDPYVISSIYQKGKALYEQGRYDEAEAEWQKLSGRVGEHSGIMILINNLKNSRPR